MVIGWIEQAFLRLLQLGGGTTDNVIQKFAFFKQDRGGNWFLGLEYECASIFQSKNLHMQFFLCLTWNWILLRFFKHLQFYIYRTTFLDIKRCQTLNDSKFPSIPRHWCHNGQPWSKSSCQISSTRKHNKSCLSLRLHLITTTEHNLKPPCLSFGCTLYFMLILSSNHAEHTSSRCLFWNWYIPNHTSWALSARQAGRLAVGLCTVTIYLVLESALNRWLSCFTTHSMGKAQRSAFDKLAPSFFTSMTFPGFKTMQDSSVRLWHLCVIILSIWCILEWHVVVLWCNCSLSLVVIANF